MFDIAYLLKYCSIGAVLGLSAGLSPGPLLTLVITETLKHNRNAGFQVALSPLITDAPIVLASVFVFSQLAQIDAVLGVVSFLGAAYIGFLGFETLRVRELQVGAPDYHSHSLKKGIIANFLSPHPYLFWITIGAPFVFKAYELCIAASILFFISFYVCLIGSKLIVAQLVSKTKIRFSNAVYLWAMRFLGVALLVFAAIFVLEGMKYFDLF